MQLALPFTAPIAPGACVAPLLPLTQLYFVRNRRARRYILRIDPDGSARVTIPRGGSRREAEIFAANHADWITRQQARLPQPSWSPEDRRVLRAQAARELSTRLLELAAKHDLLVSRVSVRNQRSRWGSCGRDGHICLNWRLMLMPTDVRDYIFLHELMHLRRMDHSPAYWKLVEAACPNFRAAREWLRRHGPALR